MVLPRSLPTTRARDWQTGRLAFSAGRLIRAGEGSLEAALGPSGTGRIDGAAEVFWPLLGLGRGLQ